MECRPAKVSDSLGRGRVGKGRPGRERKQPRAVDAPEQLRRFVQAGIIVKLAAGAGGPGHVRRAAGAVAARQVRLAAWRWLSRKTIPFPSAPARLMIKSPPSKRRSSS